MKVILKNILLMVFVATIIMSAITVSSAEYADTLRVGIYYDTGTVTSLDIGSDVGFNVGIVNGTSFTPVIENTGEVVRSELDRTEGVPSYHVSYSAHSTPQEAAEAIEILKGQGIEAFAGYVNSSYLALGGNFKNNNDATWAAGNLSVKDLRTARAKRYLLLMIRWPGLEYTARSTKIATRFLQFREA